MADGSAMRVPIEPEELVETLHSLDAGTFFQVGYPNPKITPWWLNPAAVQHIAKE
jgi:hypothetical protein